jgi:hypothetical protein
MLLAPLGNETFPCLGVEVHNSLRPPRSPEFVNLVTGFGAFLVLLYLCSIPVLYYVREDPRFRKIRPFSLTTFLMSECSVWTFGILYWEAFDGYPCALNLFFHVLGAVTATSFCSVRALVFVIESQYALVVSNETQVIDHIARASESAASVKKDEPDFGHDYVNVLKEVLMLGFGFRDITKMPLKILSQIRRSYLFIVVVISLPPFLAYVIGVLSVPIYHSSCTNCPLTIEFVLIVMCSPTVFLIFIARLVYLGTRVKQDEQQIIKELTLIVTLAAHWIYIGYILELVDPEQSSFNRIFSWQILTSLGGFFSWFVLVFIQVLKTIQYRRNRAVFKRIRPDSISVYNFLDELSLDPDLKKEFDRFAVARYTAESLNFLSEVKAYKQQFERQNEKWRRTKAKSLIDIYIRLNSLQEVNISDSARGAVLGIQVESCDSNKLFSIFDTAFQEVNHMVATGIWSDFKHLQSMLKKSTSKQGAISANSISPSSVL